MRRRLSGVGFGLVLALLLVACQSDPVVLSGEYPIGVTDERVSDGVALYAAHCATCHADPETGGQRRYGAPRHDEDGHTWHHADRQLVEWVLNGVPGSTVMPMFGNQLSEEQVASIFAYLKSTWNAEVREFQDAGSQTWEDQLAEG
jgi:mono/diheme cytochrome c family protein